MAKALCEPFELPPGARIFDPTMGEGALLLAAAEHSQGSSVELMGCDLDPRTVSSVRERQPSWKVGRADIFSRSSRKSSPIWRSATCEGVDLVVLNPPFSYRGKQRKPVELLGSTFRATPAVAALTIVLGELEAQQGVGVVLPEGSFRGEINEDAWQAIHSHFHVETIQRLPRGSFPNAKASSVLLAVRRRKEPALLRVTPTESINNNRYLNDCRCVEVIRGRLRNCRLRERPIVGSPFVHTTNLVDGKLARLDIYEASALATKGPMLLLPRVGRFSADKVVIVESDSLVLSDCVMALRIREPARLSALRSVLLHPVVGLARRYSGTGAPYITIRDLMSILRVSGFVPRHIAPYENSFDCFCAAELVQSKSAS